MDQLIRTLAEELGQKEEYVENVVKLLRADDWIRSVKVVQLDLDKFHVGMLVGYLVQEFRASVVGKAKALYAAGFFHLPAPVKAIKLFVSVVVVSVLD